MGFSFQWLSAQAGYDPWALRDQFTAGDPEEIYAMARGFRDAAVRQGEAVVLATAGLETTAAGYRVGNSTPHDVSAEVARAREDLGGGGEKLGRIATILSTIASDLAQRTTRATLAVRQLEADLAALAAERANALAGSAPAAPAAVGGSPTVGPGVSDNTAAVDGSPSRLLDSYEAQAVQKVRTVGEAVGRSVVEYEDLLAGQVRAMADLGYAPPATMDEGPAATRPELARRDGETLALILAGGAGGWGDGAIEENLAGIASRLRGYADDPAALRAFYDAAGGSLLRLPDYLRDVLGLDEQACLDILRPLGDGLLALSNLPGGEANIPPAIRDVLGIADNDGGIDAADAGSVHGLAELLSASTIPGNPRFVAHVGRAIGRAREELDDAVAIDATAPRFDDHVSAEAWAYGGLAAEPREDGG